MNFHVSKTKLYPKYIEVSFFLLSNDFHVVFSYIKKQDQQKRKYYDKCGSNIRARQLIDDINWH